MIRSYIQSNRGLIRFEVALDTDRDAKRTYDVIETPTLYVLDHENKVLFKHSGVLTKDDVRNIENLIETRR